eukprot:4770072-Prymnesium_polylepis.1
MESMVLHEHDDPADGERGRAGAAGLRSAARVQWPQAAQGGTGAGASTGRNLCVALRHVVFRSDSASGHARLGRQRGRHHGCHHLGRWCVARRPRARLHDAGGYRFSKRQRCHAGSASHPTSIE